MAVGFFSYSSAVVSSGRPVGCVCSKTEDEIATDVAKTRGDVTELGERMTKLAVDSANHFDSIDKQLSRRTSRTS